MRSFAAAANTGEVIVANSSSTVVLGNLPNINVPVFIALFVPAKATKF